MAKQTKKTPKKSKMIELGCLAKEKVTGCKGIVIGITEWMTGCDSVGIRPRELKDGKPIDAQWFDIITVDRIGNGITINQNKSALPGGPKPTPRQR